jgi:hypothetical protein
MFGSRENTSAHFSSQSSAVAMLNLVAIGSSASTGTVAEITTTTAETGIPASATVRQARLPPLRGNDDRDAKLRCRLQTFQYRVHF